jgi:hypothetical protein
VIRLIFWLLVAVGLFYGFYSGAMAVWSYMQVTSVVDSAATERLRSGAGIGQLRDAVLRGAVRSGIPLDERAIEVTPREGAVAVRVHWSYTVATFNNEPVFVIPLSVTRVYPVSR